MDFTRRFTTRAWIKGSILALSLVASSMIAPQVRAATSTQSAGTVFVVRDATQESHCTVWHGSPTNTLPCPAGSVVWSYPLAQSDADAQHLAYVTPTTDIAATNRAVASMADRVHASLAPDSVHKPNIAAAGCPAYGTNYAQGGQYTNQDGHQISYYVGYQANGVCYLMSIFTSAKMYGCCTNWQGDRLTDPSTGNFQDFDRGCQALTNSWSANQQIPNTWPTGEQYTNYTSTCGLFPKRAYGFTYLTTS